MEIKYQQSEYPVRLYLSTEQVIEKQPAAKCNEPFSEDNTEEYTERRSICIRLVETHHHDNTKSSSLIPVYRDVLLHFDTVLKPYLSRSLEHHNQLDHNDKNSYEF